MSAITWTMQIIVQSRRTTRCPLLLCCICIAEDRSKQIEHHLLFCAAAALARIHTHIHTQKMKNKTVAIKHEWQIPNQRFYCRSEWKMCFSFWKIAVVDRSINETTRDRIKQKKKKTRSSCSKTPGKWNHILESLRYSLRFQRWRYFKVKVRPSNKLNTENVADERVNKTTLLARDTNRNMSWIYKKAAIDPHSIPFKCISTKRLFCSVGRRYENWIANVDCEQMIERNELGWMLAKYQTDKRKQNRRWNNLSTYEVVSMKIMRIFHAIPKQSIHTRWKKWAAFCLNILRMVIWGMEISTSSN